MKIDMYESWRQPIWKSENEDNINNQWDSWGLRDFSFLPWQNDNFKQVKMYNTQFHDSW
jgi:hypothetical protein